METRWVDVLTRVYPNPKTRDNYASRLRGLQRHIDRPLLDILRNPDVYYSEIQKAYPALTTRKNVLTVILVLFREDDVLKTPEYAATAAQWKKLHEDLTRLQIAKVKRSEPEQKQIDKYTSFEEIELKYQERKRKGSHATLKDSMRYVLLSIILHLRPKRADLGALEIYHEDDPRKTTANYIVLRTDGSSYLVMNLYKTSKYYQTVEEDMPEALVNDIQTSLRRWPRKFLFVKENGDPMSNNTYSVFVKHTFEDLFGRSTGVSLLRHIYITEKLNFDDMTLEERDNEAKLMLHTSGLQQQYKWPKKTICPKVCLPYIKPSHKTRKIKRKKPSKAHPTV